MNPSHIPINRILFFVFSIPVLSFGNGWFFSLLGLNYNYLCLFFFLALLIIFQRKLIFHKVIFLLVLCILLIWSYGVLLGVINGYEPMNVFRNSIGILFFSSIFIVAALKPSFEDILRILVISAILVFLLTILVYLSLFNMSSITVDLKNWAMNNTYGIIGGGEYGFRVFISNQIIIFPIISYLLFSKSIKNKILALMLFIFLYFFTVTRAYFLCFSFIFSFLIMLSLLYRRYAIFSIVMILVIGLAIYSMYNSTLLNSLLSIVDFSGKNLSNLPRREQFQWMVEYLNKNPVTGYGFGFFMPEYIRSLRVNYSYELMYVDLFLKLGLPAILLIMIYFAPLILCLKRRNLLDKETALVIGIVSANLASIGNPFLFTQHNVYLIVIAYYIVLYDKKYKVHLNKGAFNRNDLLTVRA